MGGEASYKTNPLKNVHVQDDTCTVSKMEGSYLVYGMTYRNGDYYHYSFYSDGSVVSVPAMGPAGLTPSSSAVTTGTWSMSGNDITVNIGGVRLTGEKLTLTDSSGNVAGWGVSQNYTDVKFSKVSDSYINTDVYTNPNLLQGLWAHTDEYGDTYGYRILAGGKYWYYPSSGTNGSEDTYSLSPTKIRLGEYSIYNEHNYTLIGQYLYLGLVSFKSTDHIVPEITEPSYAATDVKLRASLKGSWMYIDPVTDETTGYYTFDSNGTAWMVNDQGRYDGTWSILDGVFTIDIGSTHLNEKPRIRPDDNDPEKFVAFMPKDTVSNYFSWNKLSANIGYTENYRDSQWQSLNLVGFCWISDDGQLLFDCKQTGSTFAVKQSDSTYSSIPVSWYMEGSEMYVQYTSTLLLQGVYLRYKDDSNQEVLHVDGIKFIGTPL